MAIQASECIQCGPSRFREADGLLHCAYCRATYRRTGAEAPPPKVFIGSGARVVIGKTARVRIAGGVAIEKGALVGVHGGVGLVDRGTGKALQGPGRE